MNSIYSAISKNLQKIGVVRFILNKKIEEDIKKQ
jgi:hypothetical protein